MSKNELNKAGSAHFIYMNTGINVAPLKPSSSPTVYRSLSLAFSDDEQEDEYARYFVERNLPKWRNGIFLFMSAATLLYIYSMWKTPYDVSRYKDFISSRTFPPSVLSSNCPSGYYCSECPASMCNERYEVWWDALFYIFGCFIPGFTAYVLSKKLRINVFSKYIHHISTAVLIIGGLVGLVFRFLIVEPRAPVYVAALIYSGFMFITVFMRIRFIHSAISLFTVIAVFICSNLYQITHFKVATNVEFVDYFALIICSITLCSIASVVCVSNWEQEKFYRTLFLSTQNLQRANFKLQAQLRNLQKTYHEKMGEFESPLETAILIVRSMMADANMGPQHLMKLTQVLTLLSSNNLLTPDFENNINDGALRMDNEQEAWLFTEIARRRHRQTQRKGSILAVLAVNAMNGSGRRKSLQPKELGTTPLKIATISSIPDIGEQQATLLNIENSLIYEEYDPLISEYNFPIFSYVQSTDGKPLSFLAMHLFTKANLFRTCQIPTDKFLNFITAIEAGYMDLPYHNRIHAADVLHAISHFISIPNIAKIISEVDLVAIYVAAAIHDYQHPGFTNNFLITTGDSRAILYNDKAVLENHHLAASFAVLRKPENNFLTHLTKNEYKLFRETVIEMVLATDLSQHLPLLTLFKNRLQNQSAFNPEELREDRILLWRMLMKLADVSNPTKQWALYEKWYQMIIDEFLRQGDEERKLRLDISPFMDRDKLNIPSSQIGFIDFVVNPLFEAFDRYIAIPSIMDTLRTNRNIWVQKKQEQTCSNLSGLHTTSDGKTSKTSVAELPGKPSLSQTRE